MNQQHQTKSERKKEQSRKLKYNSPTLLMLIAIIPVVIFIINDLLNIDTFSLVTLGGIGLIVIYIVFEKLSRKKDKE